MTTSRDAILHRIRTALAHEPPRDRPPVPAVWPRQNPDAQAMAARFTEELAAVSGEVHRCGTLAQAQSLLARWTREHSWQAIGVMDRPICRQLAGALDHQLLRLEPSGEPAELAPCDAAIIAADLLLADTGSTAVAAHSAHDRLLCYLPPVCVVIAGLAQLREHLPAAWDELVARVADPQSRGELVLITGPSRTADIEKILILGVHGPKRLLILLVDSLS